MLYIVKHGLLVTMHLSRDGMFLASHTSNNTIQIQNSATGAQVSLVNDNYDDQGKKNKQLVKLSNNAKFLAFGWLK